MIGTTWQAIRAEHEADRVREEEKKTKEALVLADRNRDEAELNLVRSFLRPLGYNNNGMEPAELVALDELSNRLTITSNNYSWKKP